ncbi:LacI family DNA-binding transcriptional regulator [Actinokineospora sp. 24-640]
MKARRVTLADVAKVAGVSTTTVSLVLSGRGRELRISGAAEQRVRATAERMGYRRAAASLGPRPGKTRTIGLVTDAVGASRLAGDVLKGVLDAARERGFMLFLGETDGDVELESALVQSMRDRQVDGVILASACTRVVKVPHGLGATPAVLLNALPERRTSLPAVLPDEVGAGRAAARVLLDAGHRDGIHLIGAGPGPGDAPDGGVAVAERLTGIHEVFAAAGVAVEGAHRCSPRLPDSGFAATRDLLRTHRPKALVCFSDRLALGAYHALRDAGLSVPADVSVVSFDDEPFASWVRPRLTTIALPHYELGAKAVDVLYAEAERRKDRNQAGGIHRVRMPVRLRESVAPPAGQPGP